jgi:hypothetical protein
MLDDAWQTGLADLFSAQDCEARMSYAGCCGISNLCSTSDPVLPAKFDADLLLDISRCLIYLRARCDWPGRNGHAPPAAKSEPGVVRPANCQHIPSMPLSQDEQLRSSG